MENKLKFINHAEADWQKISDSVGNLVFDVAIPKENYDSTTKIFSYEVNKSFDLFADLKIGAEKPLITQDFVILAVDESGGATTLPISVIGDSESPKLTIDRITLNDDVSSQTINIKDGIIKLPVVKPTTRATFYGTWSDNSTTYWNDISKINDIKFEWLDVDAKNFVDFKKTGNTWEVTVEKGSVPKVDGAITATLIDYANNIVTLSQTVTVEKSEIGLDRITCDSEDGSYNAGKELIINLEFTKSAKFKNDEDKKPYLVLNNGAQALYCGKNEDISSGTSRHQFKYIVKETDTNIPKLDVSSINSNGCSWVDANTDAVFEIQQSEIDTLVSNNKTLNQRNIVIDTQAPFVNEVICISSEGSYKKDKELIFKIEFNEDVNVKEENNLKLTFDSVEMDHVKTVKSGSKTLLSTYKVKSGDAALLITGISANGSEVEDYAGNEGNFEPKDGAIKSTNVKIDTIKPQKPTISVFDNNAVLIDNNAVLIDDNASVSVTITGEDNASILYSIDNGATWNVYNSPITLSNNGEYKIIAKQIDIAGNEYELPKPFDSDVKTVTIDKGALIKKISATTFNGTYKTDDEINGYIEFRGPVTLSDNFAITLNVKNNGNATKITKFTPGENNKYDFVYKVSKDDVLDDDYLNVSAISGNVTYEGQSKTISKLPASNLANNREIKILTGQPKVKDVSITGEDENAKLNITFDRVVSKGSGNIELAISEGDFLIPTVLTESEYNDISVKINELGTYYKPGLNGATKNDDNTLTPDTTKKYILVFNTNNNDSDLKGKFINAGLNKVVIPMYSSAVSVTESSITVDLTGEYKLPVKGAEYLITISAGAVKDSVGNTNGEYKPEDKKLAPGVEKPEIRIQKNDYEIYWEDDATINTKNAKVRMPEIASMKISCRTPSAVIKYDVNPEESSVVKVNDIYDHDSEKPGNVKVRTPSTPYDKATNLIELGTNNLTFDTAKGLKIAIVAMATIKNYSDESFEYAVRTVLKWEVDSYSKSDSPTEIKEGDEVLKLSDLHVWVIGGDSFSGDNTITPFPLSWKRPKLLKRDSGTSINGKWYWITWDLSAPAYHTFVVGDVPDDAQKYGPKTWYAGDSYYVPLKQNYKLYPGATLVMQLVSGFNAPGVGSFYFKLTNKGTRWLEPGETE